MAKVTTADTQDSSPDPLDALEETGEEIVDPYALAPVQKLLRGEWDVYEAHELIRMDDRKDSTGSKKTPALYISVSASTWMVNERAHRTDYILDFAKTPRRALRDFACWPTAVEEPWLRDPTVLERAVNERRSSPFDDRGIFSDDFQPDEDATYFVHIDFALRRDAAGLAMGHWCEEKHRCVIDLATNFTALETENLDLGRIRALVYELVARGFNIAECTLDKWNSADTIAEFERRGLRAREISDAEQIASYDGLLELLIFGMIDFYPQEILFKELRELQWKGQRLDHPESGSKDIADAVSVVAAQSRTHGSNLVAFASSYAPISREEAPIASSEQRDRLLHQLLNTDSDANRRMGIE